MKTYSVNIPDEAELSQFEFNMMVAANLYERRKLSLGQAADMVNLSKQAFAELLGKYGVNYFNQSSDEILDDIKNA